MVSTSHTQTNKHTHIFTILACAAEPVSRDNPAWLSDSSGTNQKRFKAAIEISAWYCHLRWFITFFNHADFLFSLKIFSNIAIVSVKCLQTRLKRQSFQRHTYLCAWPWPWFKSYTCLPPMRIPICDILIHCSTTFTEQESSESFQQKYK